MPLTGSHTLRGKMSMKEKYGIFRGRRMRSDEAIIGTTSGVVRAKFIRRLSEDKCLDPVCLHMVRGRSSQPVPGRAGDVIPVHVTGSGQAPGLGIDVDELQLDHTPQGEHVRNIPRPDADMKRMTERVELLHKYGFFDGCSGCAAVKARKKYYVHSDECRGVLRGKSVKVEGGQRRLQREDEQATTAS